MGDGKRKGPISLNDILAEASRQEAERRAEAESAVGVQVEKLNEFLFSRSRQLARGDNATYDLDVLGHEWDIIIADRLKDIFERDGVWSVTTNDHYSVRLVVSLKKPAG